MLAAVTCLTEAAELAERGGRKDANFVAPFRRRTDGISTTTIQLKYTLQRASRPISLLDYLTKPLRRQCYVGSLMSFFASRLMRKYPQIWLM